MYSFFRGFSLFLPFFKSDDYSPRNVCKHAAVKPYQLSYFQTKKCSTEANSCIKHVIFGVIEMLVCFITQ